MTFSFQLYSARNFTPWDPVFKTIAELGYTQVEGYGSLYEDPASLKAMLDTHGLTMPSGHFSLDALENDFPSVLSAANTLGCTRLFCPHITEDLRAPNQKGWQNFAQRLQHIGNQLREQGLRFGWHNHDFEFISCRDGSIPMRVLLETASDIDWEIDVAWVARGGSDPVQWIREYGSRITAVHIKDIAGANECIDEDGWADVGHGTLDWPGLMQYIKQHTNAELLVAEHDNPNDFNRFASRSITAMKSHP